MILAGLYTGLDFFWGEGGGRRGGNDQFLMTFSKFQGKKSQNTAVMDYLCYYNYYYVSLSV